MVPVAMLAQISTAPGQTFAISAFIPALRDSLGLSESGLTTAYMVGTFVAAFPLLLVGPLADRFGNRITMTVAILALSGTCFLASTVDSFPALMFVFLMLRFLGQGTLSLLSSNTVAMWFRHRLGRVSAIMSAGMAAAFALIPGGLVVCIDSLGWRTSYQLLGVLVAGIMLPLMILVYRNQPSDVGQHPDGLAPEEYQALLQERSGSLGSTLSESWNFSAAVRSHSYWIIAISMAIWAMTGTGLVFYLIELGNARQIAAESTAKVFGTFALSMLLAQLVGGTLADRYPQNRLLSCGFALLTLGTTCLWFATSLLHLHLFAAFFGAGQGVAIVIAATIWVRYFGPDHLGKIRGTAWSVAVAGSGIGPFILGAIKDATGSFQPGIIAFVILLAPLILITLTATQPKKATLSVGPLKA